MSDETRVQQLVNEVLDSERTPEEICADCPELVGEVRKRSRLLLSIMEMELDAMFPTPDPDRDTNARVPWNPATDLPSIPGHQVEAVLGRGGMGIVYKARHLSLNRPVAVKMLLAGAYAGPAERQRFFQEAEAVAGLRHANLVQVFDLGEHDGRPYFTMEYVEGGSLAQRLMGTPLGTHYAAVLVASLAAAVQVAHQNGIIHRDLKPANILLQPKVEIAVLESDTENASPLEVVPTPLSSFVPKIADFGLARHFDTGSVMTLSGTRVGTPSYMAPEQALGKIRSIGPTADIYSLGAVLYELLTGRPPFRGETSVETELQVIHQEPVPPSRLNPKVPCDLETICLKCLEKDPARRYATAAALADDLHRFLEGRPIQARPVGRGERLWRWSRRKPAAAALVVTALALVGLAIGGGLWLERQRADRREEKARQEGRVEAALDKAEALQQQGRWSEARAVLEEAQSHLGAPAPEELLERLRQAGADADMVAELEEIRLRMSAGPKDHEAGTLTPEKVYADAFRKYGIPLLTLEPGEAVARIRKSAIRETLLAFLHDWLYWVSDENRTRLSDVLDQADDDGWRHAFREALVKKDADKLNALAHAPEAPDQPPVLVSGLAGAMLGDKYRNEAMTLLRKAQEHYPGDFWINYLLGQFWSKERPQEAIGYFRVAVAIRPTSDGAYLMLGRALRDSGDADGAIAAFRRSVALNPNYDVSKELVTALSQRGGLEQTRAAWEKLLELDPPDHDSWYGYAELCLFLGREDDYRRARRDLLKRFGATTDPFVAERTGRACLLMPATGDELSQAAAVANHAVAFERLDRANEQWAHPYFLFVRGLAEYRQGQFDPAISTMQGDASHVLGPAPGLVLAMALHRSGRVTEARKTLAAAVLAHDWRANQIPVRDYNSWIYHVLRREAESIILPNLPAFLNGKYQPPDNDERLALLGACQFANRTRAIAHLYADAFAASPPLADDLDAGHRYNAARAAALTGCGHGQDAPGLAEEEGKRWRDQARQWLRAELAARTRALDADPTAAHFAVHEALTRWRKEPDLAGVRDSTELDKLAPDERKECLSFWSEVAAVLARTEK